MAYVEIQYHNRYALEVREFGDQGWAIHVYAPRSEQRPSKIAIVTTTGAGGLEQLITEAKARVDLDLSERK
ncbi:hypothetical protein [Pseudoroseomonas sp. WGS1072]|uniref:hypothetical protein n=1 Tax=Roseomonas sp. WGS1072 TaxID=3366816 RepID=UPI003BF27610